jgi:hypothetical protein
MCIDDIGNFLSDPFGSKDLAKKTARDAQAAKDQAEADEAARKAAIAQGNANIDAAFSQFDDDYFRNFKNTYRGYYNPQLDEQYADSVGKLTAALAGRGQLGGTVGDDAFRNVVGRYDDERARIGNEAETAAADLLGRIEGQKSGLYTLNQAAADPEGINARARAEATSLVAPPTYSQLGQVFQDLINPYLGYRNSLQNSLSAGTYTPAYATISGGSGRIVK